MIAIAVPQQPSPLRRPLTLTPGPRLGSRSPASIPSSPTSVHSSSSAIFERDIEQPAQPLPQSSLSTNPHRTPRARSSEPIDHCVPTVLASAAEALNHAGEPGSEEVEIVAPISLAVGSFQPSTSRSPSPPPSVALWVQTASASQQHPPHSPTNSPPFTAKPQQQVPSSPSPPPTAIPEQSPAPQHTALHPDPSPSQTPSKRLSYVSHHDLLTGPPLGAFSLSSLTTHVPSGGVPPHLPGVAGSGSSVISGGGSVMGDEGGEWEREGLGRGLEERLEALMASSAGSNPGSAPPSARPPVLPLERSPRA